MLLGDAVAQNAVGWVEGVTSFRDVGNGQSVCAVSTLRVECGIAAGVGHSPLLLSRAGGQLPLDTNRCAWDNCPIFVFDRNDTLNLDLIASRFGGKIDAGAAQQRAGRRAGGIDGIQEAKRGRAAGNCRPEVNRAAVRRETRDGLHVLVPATFDTQIQTPQELAARCAERPDKTGHSEVWRAAGENNVVSRTHDWIAQDAAVEEGP